MMELWEHEKAIGQVLAQAGADSPGLCARMLITYVTGLDSVGYMLAAKRMITPQEERILYTLVDRRARGEPMAYIIGKKSFYEHDFAVSPATLVPRPETELLVDLALKYFPQKQIFFADIGTGSGCIGLSLLAKRPHWIGFLLDYAHDALRIARGNAHIANTPPVFLQSDMFAMPFRDSTLDLIISNPPYIDQECSKDLLDPALAYEPHSALFSSQCGLAHLDGLIRESQRVLLPNGFVIVEHGFDQGARVTQILTDYGFKNIVDHHDLAGLPRCATARKGE